jgi:uncharacterized membrane protein YgcG
MKRVAFGLLLVLLSTLSGAQGFRITSFDADLTLDKDGALHVIERIDVVFTESHHGIFRDIPVDYDSGKGFTRSIILENVHVTDGSGQKQQTQVNRAGSTVRIRIGNPDEYMPLETPVTYVIGYDSFGQMNWFGQDSSWKPYCELYWNLTGNEWQEDMEKVHFTLHFPAVASKSDLRARLFPGVYGSRGFQQLIGTQPRQGDPATKTYMELAADHVEGGTTAPMRAGEGLTVVLDMPADTISKPTALQQAILILRPNLGLTIPLIALAGMFIVWSLYGKDPPKKPIAVQFEPPDGISGPEAGTLLDERVDMRDLAAGIISLAVKGYLTLTPAETGLVFKKRTATITLTGNGKQELTPFETLLLKKLENCTQPIDESELRIHVAPHVAQLRGSLYDSMVDRGYYISNPNSVRLTWLIGGFIAIALLGFLFTVLNPTGDALPSIIGGVIGAAIVAAFSQLMPRRTMAGAEAQQKTAGFEEFIRRARGKELDWMSKKDPTASLFEEYLPHAIAFGLAAEWAAAFEGILHEMPRWYAAPYGTPFYPGYFASDMVSISNNLGNAAMVPPRSSGASGGSSGFGGGGFSGGGFGGGGGGSW